MTQVTKERRHIIFWSVILYVLYRYTRRAILCYQVEQVLLKAEGNYRKGFFDSMFQIVCIGNSMVSSAIWI
jgi:hypothetical protein